MRALLVVNPKATATTPRVRDVLARALGSDLKVDVAETQRRGHAIELGAQASDEGLDLVVVLGGDGTVNEVVNGLLRPLDRLADADDVEGAEVRAALPALAVVPGGSTNVFSRALDIPHDPVEATGHLLDALKEGRSRRIGLGRADERWFTFTAGIGLDADAVRRVEHVRAGGKNATPTRYAWAAIRQFFRSTDRRHPALTLEIPGQEPVDGLYLGIVCNTSPWTYFGDHPITVTPTASFDSGLDLAAMRKLRTVGTLRAAAGMLGREGIRGRHVCTWADLSEFTLRADRPMHVEVDGDYLGEREGLRLRSVPAALRVVC
ncbi:MAG: diacylglycerol kinase [Frankiaceae bacterium]|nr:diacylglycerol kinase [Frankiaceae bacterium]MBV9369589.1 diacylglycerol kinase [Frankiales bacterium]